MMWVSLPSICFESAGAASTTVGIPLNEVIGVAPKHSGGRLALVFPVRLSQTCHSSQVQSQTDELPLGLHLLETTETELPEAQHGFDPAVRWFDDRFAAAVGLFCSRGLQTGPPASE